MLTELSPSEEAALAWIARLGDPGFADWDALTEWLADAEHAATFGRLRDRDVAVAAALAAQGPSARRSASPPESANDNGGRRAWFAASAAAMILMVAGGLLWSHHPESVVKVAATPPGKSRDLKLADGSLVSLNGGSQVRVSNEGRHVDLLAGQASFTVAHDASRPFTVAVAGAVISDVGTRFDIVRRDGGVFVAVAEGAVSFRVGSSDGVLVAANRTLEWRGTTVRLGTVRAADVGGWREGRLSYDNAPLGWIAADIGRATGRTVNVSSGLDGRRFSGTILLDRDNAQFRYRVQALLGVAVLTKGDAWLLVPASHASP